MKKINAALSVPELVEGDKAKYTLHAASSLAKECGVQKGEAFFIPFDQLRDPAKSILRKWFLNNSAASAILESRWLFWNADGADAF